MGSAVYSFISFFVFKNLTYLCVVCVYVYNYGCLDTCVHEKNKLEKIHEKGHFRVVKLPVIFFSLYLSEFLKLFAKKKKLLPTLKKKIVFLNFHKVNENDQ